MYETKISKIKQQANEKRPEQFAAQTKQSEAFSVDFLNGIINVV